MDDLKDFDGLIDRLATTIEELRRRESAFQESVEAKCRPLRAERDALKEELTRHTAEIETQRRRLAVAQEEAEALRGRLRELCRGLRGLLADVATAEEHLQ